MDVICISNRKIFTNALEHQCGANVKLKLVGSFLECLEALNFHVPKAIVIDMADYTVDDYDMIAMFPPQGSDEYIPLISISMPGGEGAIGDHIEDYEDQELMAAHIMQYIERHF